MKSFKTLALLTSLAASLSLFAGSIAAQELTGTLKKIKEAGTITLGARESSAPFSYSLGNDKFVGFSVDLMMKIVDRLTGFEVFNHSFYRAESDPFSTKRHA